MKRGANEYAEIIAMQAIQENLLQSYRNIFLFSQSILLAVAAIIASQPQGGYFSLFLMPIGVFLCVSWWLTDRSRGLDAAFFGRELLRIEKGEKVSSVYHAYCDWTKLSARRKWCEMYDSTGGETIADIVKNWTLTRVTMGTILPFLFMALWIIMLLYFLLILPLNLIEVP